MNDLEQAARQALEALEDIFGKEKKDVGAINALRQALENHESAYQRGYLDGMAKPCIDCADRKLQALEQQNQFNPDWATQAVLVEEMQRMAKRIEKLEAATPQPARKWVGLTNNEVWNVLQFRGYNSDTIKIAKAIQAAIKEKNT